MHPSTAILVFTRSAKEESREKNFAGDGNSGLNLSISTRFISRTIREVRKSRIPYFIISSDRQRGSSFGERLTNAFGEIFAAGFENVISVGNDSPQLNAAILRAAAQSLEVNKVVLGPDERGGAYLIGIAKSCFHADAFTSFRWNTAELFAGLLNWSRHSGIKTKVLPPLADVNFSSDLRKLFGSHHAFLPFLKLLQSIFAGAGRSFSEPITRLFIALPPFSLPRRGPPCC